MGTVASASRLWLDHVSLVVPDVASASVELESRWGLRVTPTPADHRHHGRIHLDRAYIEVSDGEPTEDWRLSHFWFLRFEDPERLRAHLAASGLEFSFGVYEGRDGRWDDVSVSAGAVPLPILVRRTSPPDVARDWPPTLRHAHPCSAVTLEAVHVTVPDLHEAVDAYSRLLGVPADSRRAEADATARFRLDGGEIVLTHGRKPGLAAFVAGVESLEPARKNIAGLGYTNPPWVDPARAPGLSVGFLEVRARR